MTNPIENNPQEIHDNTPVDMLEVYKRTQNRARNYVFAKGCLMTFSGITAIETVVNISNREYGDAFSSGVGLLLGAGGLIYSYKESNDLEQRADDMVEAWAEFHQGTKDAYEQYTQGTDKLREA